MGKFDQITDKTMIEIKNLSKVYHLYERPVDRLREVLSIRHKVYHKKHYALKNINLEIKKGESIGIIGVNGSGKSTLLKIITGVLNATEGEVKTYGKIAALLELGAGFNPEYTGIENIFLNGTMMGYSEEEMQEKLDSIIEFADIGEFIRQPVKVYSSGMFARLAFAVSISVEPEILIVDEALSVGDLRFQIKCMERMKEMMQGGTTVLFVSHDINAMRRFCTKVVWLRKGEIEEMGDTNKVSDKYMDFLKIGEEYYEALHNGDAEENTGKITTPEQQAENIIAEVSSFQLLDEQGNDVRNIGIHQCVKVKVCYEVFDERIEKPVLGIAIRGMDDDYVCGLNTLLDDYEIPWKKGMNSLTLTYPHGLLAVGGQYYFDVALMEQTATVPFQYISVVKKFSIYSGYQGEGRYIIPHEWSVE